MLAFCGSITIDDITLAGASHRGVLGGSAVYAALAARPLGRSALMGLRGPDSDSLFSPLEGLANLDLSGALRVDGQTERWSPVHHAAGASAVRDHRPGVAAWPGFEGPFPPHPCAGLFLGSLHPARQAAALGRAAGAALVGFDTMRDYLLSHPADVGALVARSHVLFATAGELSLLLPGAAEPDAAALERWTGLRAVVTKLGPGGARLRTRHGHCHLPAAPTRVVDPTGAGDALAGAMMASLARSFEELPVAALAFGLGAAAVAISAVGPAALLQLTTAAMEEKASWCLERQA